MLKYVGKRLLLAIPMLIIVSVVMFVLASILPGDPAVTILGEDATPEALAALRDQMGLNLPWYQQYVQWALAALHGDFGTSIFGGQSVQTVIMERLPVTLSLMVASTLVIAVVGVGLGLLSAVRGGWVGRVLDSVSMLGLALPTFALAVVLVTLLAVNVHIFPATGYFPATEGIGRWLWGLVLPVVAMSLSGTTLVAKQMRDSALEVLSRDSIRVLRANGISERSILFRHVLKNAAIPATTVLGVGAINALTGAVFIENVFVLPGLGSLATQSTLTHDMPVLLGLGVYFTLIVVVTNLVVDVVYGFINPKVRVS